MAGLSTKTKIIAVAVMFGLFLLGGVTGAAAMRAYHQQQFRAQLRQGPGPARAKMRLRAMRRFLELTDDQTGQIETILDEAETKHRALFEQCGPELKKLRTDTEAKIEAVLTEEQRADYEKLLERRRKGRRGHRGRRRGPRDGRPPDGPRERGGPPGGPPAPEGPP